MVPEKWNIVQLLKIVYILLQPLSSTHACDSARRSEVSLPDILVVPLPVTLINAMSDKLSFSLSKSEPTE